jgi:hypothetical protein
MHCPGNLSPEGVVCQCENPGPHLKPGAVGKFCAVCGLDILPNAELSGSAREKSKL